MSEEGPSHLPNEVTVKYKKADSYTKIQANNTSTHSQPRGDVKIDFELNYYPDPNTETFKIAEDGSMGERVGYDGDDDVLIDEKQASVLLEDQAAFELATTILSELVSDPRNSYNPAPPDEISNIIRGALMDHGAEEETMGRGNGGNR